MASTQIVCTRDSILAGRWALAEWALRRAGHRPTPERVRVYFEAINRAKGGR